MLEDAFRYKFGSPRHCQDSDTNNIDSPLFRIHTNISGHSLTINVPIDAKDHKLLQNTFSASFMIRLLLSIHKQDREDQRFLSSMNTHIPFKESNSHGDIND